MIPAKEIDGELWIRAADHHKAIKEALAQPEQEPYGWYIDGYGAVIGTAEPKSVRIGEWLPWYTTPPQPQPEQEPAFWYSAQEDEFMTHKTRKEHERLNSYTHKVGKFDLALYTTPPQRTWVGLTRAERFEIEKDMSKYYDYQHQCKTVCLPEFAAAIEAKLKEKNT